MAVFNSTVYCSVPHCLSFVTAPTHFALAFYLQAWRHNFPVLTTLRAKLAYVSEYWGLGYDDVSGERFPTFRRYCGSHCPTDTPSSHRAWILSNTAVRTTYLTLRWIQRHWCPACVNNATTKCTGKKPLDKHIMCVPTVLLITEFLTLITLVILTNYTDLTCAGVSNNCGYIRSHIIVTAGCNICMIRLLHIQPSYIPCVALRDSKFYLPALLDLALNELVQLSYHGCGLCFRQNRTAHETFSWEMSCKMKKGGNQGLKFSVPSLWPSEV